MECVECETGGATRVTVEYTIGRTEKLALCPGCWVEFGQGGFVQDVSLSS